MSNPATLKAWHKVFSGKGSKQAQDRLKAKHGHKPEFQTFLKSVGSDAGESVGKANKTVQKSERVKALQAKSAQAYGATRGTRTGSAEGTGEQIKDTVKPLTRDQWSKVQTAQRAAKAAEKANRPKVKPEDRLSFIRSAFGRAKSPKRQARFDTPVLNRFDRDHDDYRDAHDALHIKGVNSKYSMDEAKAEPVYEPKVGDNVRTRKMPIPGKVEKIEGRKVYFRHESGKLYATHAGNLRKEEVEQVNEMDSEGHRGHRGDEDPGKGPAKYVKPVTTKKTQDDAAKVLAKSFDKDKVKKEEVELDETVATAQKVADRAAQVAKKEPNTTKRMAAWKLHDKAKLRTINATGVNTGITRGGGNKALRRMGGKPQPQEIPKTGVSEEVELDETIRKVSGGFRLVSKKSGKNLGTYSTKAGAEKRERQVQYFKHRAEAVEMPTINEGAKEDAEELLGGPVKEKPKMPPGKQPAGYRYVRNLARKAMKKGMKEEVELTEAPKNDREYGYEGDMAMSQLKSVITNAQKLHDMLKPDTDLPEWVQLKITLAEDYIVTAANYMNGELDEAAIAEEVGQTEEGYRGPWPKEWTKQMANIPRTAIVRDKDKKGVYTSKTVNGKEVSRKYDTKEKVVTEAEGSIPKTPKEKELAKHHGDPKRITFGDVVKARQKNEETETVEEELTGDQHKLDVNKNNKVDAHDLRVLRMRDRLKAAANKGK